MSLEAKIPAIMQKMILASGGSRHDICHFLKVWGYARTIAQLESVGPEERAVLETAAIVHDIACPSLRARFGHADGKLQEREGPAMARELLAEFGLTEAETDRVAFLVGHHHTCEGVDGMDWQILLEADYLVNADESGYSAGNIRGMKERVFRTKAGTELLKGIYGE